MAPELMPRSAALWPAAIFWLITGCGSEGPSGPTVLPDLALDTVATGMSHPLFVTTPPGDQARLFLVERTGQIRIIKNGSLLATPFLDITSSVSTGAEQGILGMAFPPDYAASRSFLVYYVDPGLVWSGNIRRGAEIGLPGAQVLGARVPRRVLHPPAPST